MKERGKQMKIKKTESTLHLRKPLWSIASVLVVVWLLGIVLLVFAQRGYEAAPVLSASKILPPELLAGPHHRVEERVTNDGYLNTYQIDSKFGTFTAVSTAVLRKRIGEINAMVVMEKVREKNFIRSSVSSVTSCEEVLSGEI